MVEKMLADISSHSASSSPDMSTNCNSFG